MKIIAIDNSGSTSGVENIVELCSKNSLITVSQPLNIYFGIVKLRSIE